MQEAQKVQQISRTYIPLNGSMIDLTFVHGKGEQEAQIRRRREQDSETKRL